MITTLGEHGTQPIIALYPCKASDMSCLDGQHPHPLAGWLFVKPPYPGGVTVLGTLSDQQLVFDVGGHQVNFNVTTHQFSKASPTPLNRPEGLAIALNGDLLIANEGTNQILQRKPDGTLTVVAGTGVAGYTGDGGPARDAELDAPSGVAVAADGTVYIADTGNNRIRAISPSGTITTIAGNGHGGDAGVGGPAVDAALSAPFAVAVARGGRLYMVDNAGLQLITSNGVLSTVLASGPGMLSVHGVRTAFSPSAIAIGKTSDLYVADSSPKLLLHLSPTGQVVNSWPIYVSRAGLATAPDGSILVTDYGFAIDRIADDRLTARVRFALHAPPGLTGGFRPSGIAVTGSGKIYADDSGVSAGSDRPEIVTITSAGQVHLLPTP